MKRTETEIDNSHTSIEKEYGSENLQLYRLSAYFLEDNFHKYSCCRHYFLNLKVRLLH